MPHLVVSEMRSKLEACLRTNDLNRAQEFIGEERRKIQKPFPAEDLTAALGALVDMSGEPGDAVAKALMELLAGDLALMYVKLSESELLRAFQACISLNDRSDVSFISVLIAIQDHVAKKKSKFMSSHALASLAASSLRCEQLIRSEFLIPVAKELFNRGAKDNGGKKDGLRGLWTKTVPGEFPEYFIETSLSLKNCRAVRRQCLPTDSIGPEACLPLAKEGNVVHGMIDRVIDILRDFTGREIVAFVDAVTRFGCTDDSRLAFSRVALDVAVGDINSLRPSDVATLLIGLSRFTGNRLKTLDCACVQRFVDKLADAEVEPGEVRPFEIVELPKCLLRNSILHEGLFQRYYGIACGRISVEEMQDAERELLSVAQVVSIFITYSKAGFSNLQLAEGLGRVLAETAVVMEFKGVQLLAVYRAINRLESAERSAFFAAVLDQINRCVYQLVALGELEVSESLALLEAGALKLECGTVLIQHTLSQSNDEKIRHEVEKLIEAAERPP
ncbi:hypothetical protein FOZ60_007672 [Perkinsus olseni]|uniref:Uncharacterized protein n=1 Tax=Perkinsus olseni TaxID=32597 RepID=A0A7J6NM21_PEROL|nr:hypothetical protein FOZ60_007672 [Perkinsus olseni]